MELGPDICYQILTFLAEESLDSLSTDGYRRLLPFSICCTQHYNFTRSAIRSLAILPLRFKLRQSSKLAPIPPYPTVLYSLQKPSRSPARPFKTLFGFAPRNRSRLPDVDIVRAVTMLPSLRALHLYRTTHITDPGLSAILLRCTHLRELRVPANHQITSAGIHPLPKCASLQSIDFGYCRNFGDDVAHLFRAMPNLKLLNVACWSITDNFISVVCQNPGLIHLDVSACPFLTERTCDLVAEYAKQLEVFNFRCCGQLRDRSHLGLVNCSSLRVVDLSLAKGLPDAAVVGFGDPVKMSALEVLRLSNCSGLTDKGVAHISNNNHIRCLDLSFCEFLTDLCISSLKKMTELEDLDLSGCSHLTDCAIASLCTLPHLRNVRLAYCRRLTDECVEHLRSSPSSPFRTIDIRSCRKFSPRGIKKLAGICETLLSSIEDKSMPGLT